MVSKVLGLLGINQIDGRAENIVERHTNIGASPSYIGVQHRGRRASARRSQETRVLDVSLIADQRAAIMEEILLKAVCAAGQPATNRSSFRVGNEIHSRNLKYFEASTLVQIGIISM